jgi:hypothetical protein
MLQNGNCDLGLGTKGLPVARSPAKSVAQAWAAGAGEGPAAHCVPTYVGCGPLRTPPSDRERKQKQFGRDYEEFEVGAVYWH